MYVLLCLDAMLRGELNSIVVYVWGRWQYCQAAWTYITNQAVYNDIKAGSVSNSQMTTFCNTMSTQACELCYKKCSNSCNGPTQG